MSQRKLRRSPALLAIFALIASLLVALGSQPASATGGWPQDLTDLPSYSLVTHPDGGATVGCAYGSSVYGAVTFDSGGTATAHIEPESGETYFDLCSYTRPQVGADGTLFATATVVNGSGHGATDVYVVANDGETRVWTTLLTADCSTHSNKKGWIDQMVLGADGNIYVHFLPYYSNGCSAPYLLMGFDADDGTKLFETALGSQYYHDDGLAAYDNGLVAKSSCEIKYISYSGVVQSTFSISSTSMLSGTIGRLAVSHDGKAFVALEKSRSYTSQCPSTSEASGIAAYTPQGWEFDYPFPVWCNNFNSLAATPDESVAFTSYSRDTEEVAFNTTVGVVAEGGAAGEGEALWAHPYPYGTFADHGFSYSNALPTVSVDLQGHVVMMRRYVKNSKDNALFVMYDGTTGDQLAAFYTDTIYPDWRKSVNQWGTDVNSLYFIGNAGSPDRLFRVPFAGLDVDYPRGALWGVSPQPGSMLDYVALGDSFSSGHGVEPFEDGTGAQGNECYRSQKAYSKLLGPDPELGLRPASFVACSGAETPHIVDTQFKGEDPQVDAIVAGTDVLTVTIGGNDVDVFGFAEECLIFGDSCDSSSSAYSTIMDKIENDLPGQLDNAYEAIADELDTVGASDAIVLVVGYPFVIREHLYGQCAYANITHGDQQGVEAVTIALNDEIAAAVVRMHQGGDQRFHHVNALLSTSPFDGHDLCSMTDRYFNLSDAHPNADGQEAYATLIKDYLLAIS